MPAGPKQGIHDMTAVELSYRNKVSVVTSRPSHPANAIGCNVILTELGSTQGSVAR